LSSLQPVRQLARHERRSAPQHVATWAGRRFDVIVRKALRGLFMRRGVPTMTPSEFERSLAMLHCYNAPEILADPDRLLAPADTLPRVTTKWRNPVPGGTHAHLTFRTPYAPVHPIYAAEFRRYDNLDTVHLFAWQHTRPPSASLLITHGWGAGSKRVHEIEFGIDWFFRRLGLDVYFYVQPFHGLRKPSRARFSGELHPSPNLMRTNEAFVQAARELRTILGIIERRSHAPIGMMGSSLGGYTTALIASIDDRLSFAVPVLPPGSLADLFWDHGAEDPVRRSAEAMGMTRERFRHAWALHSPLSYAPRVPAPGRMIVSALGDALVPARSTEELWHHWQRPRHVRFAGGHILQVYRRQYQHRVARMLVDLGHLCPAAYARAKQR
jgi:hypothetical protein